MASTSTAPASRTTTARTSDPLYSAVIGLATLGVLLQGLWAGLFLREGVAGTEKWVEVHGAGADVTIGLALVATIVAFVRLRARKDLIVGSVALLVLLALEAYLGGLIVDEGAGQLTAVHVPLAMLLMAVAVWLPLRSRGRG